MLKLAISAYTPPAFDAPVRGVPVEYCYAVWGGKTRKVWLLEGEKILMIIRFDRIHERDGHTDGQTDMQAPHDDIGRACIALRGKKRKPALSSARHSKHTRPRTLLVL